MSNSQSSSSSSITFNGLLQLLFITLKLTHVIDWSWWWVMSPSLFGAGVLVILVFFWLIARLSD